MSEQIIFPQNVELGKYYLVSCVLAPRGTFYAAPTKDEFIPINSHLHEDKKVIGVDFKHWHIDWRFVSKRMWDAKIKGGENNWNQTQASSEGKLEVKLVVVLSGTQKGISVSRNVSDETIYYKKRKCIRPYSAPLFYEHDIHRMPKGWPQELSKVFCNSKLKKVGDSLICPHKGTHIDKNCKDTNGNYVCPSHLLRFDPITLKVVQTI